MSGTILDPAPARDAPVPEREFARHLTYPDGRIPGGRSGEIAADARAWYEAHGRPWSFAREVEIVSLDGPDIRLAGGDTLESALLADRLRRADCRAAYVLAVSAGEEVDEEIRRRWSAGRPDEAFALNAYAAALAEQLIVIEGAKLCACAEEKGRALLPHYSPGYDGWDLLDQFKLLRIVTESGAGARLSALPTGQLIPQKSMLALLGVTDRKDLAEPVLVPCVTCSMDGCRLRRAPFQGVAPPPETQSAGADADSAAPKKSAAYAFPRKALDRWSDRLVSIEPEENGRVRAQFRYEGSTCSDGGVPLAIVYEIELGPADGGRVIERMDCRPDNALPGFRSMCTYLSDPDGIRAGVETFRPLRGRPLADALAWEPEVNQAGCLCSQANRNHKWLLALQAIHYALARCDD